jgi:NAD(P)-dependent dehydrogenase (short-subunit alcohol dehydrogenase family)
MAETVVARPRRAPVLPIGRMAVPQEIAKLAAGDGAHVVAIDVNDERTDRGPLLSLTPHFWSFTFAVNVDAIFHSCHADLPHMIAAGGGAIVNTASQRGPAPGAPLPTPMLPAFNLRSRVIDRLSVGGDHSLIVGAQ